MIAICDMSSKFILYKYPIDSSPVKTKGSKPVS